MGEVQAGQRVLVNGAAGGVGTYAVQIAAALGAEVTGVCSTRNVELVRSIGAAHVIDYTTEDFTDGRARYDVILDNVGNRPLSRLRRALTPTGTLVLNGGGSPGHVFGAVGSILRAVVVNRFVRAAAPTAPDEQNREELLTVTGLIEAGKLTPVVDRTYPLADTAEGLRHVEQGHARGKVVITVRVKPTKGGDTLHSSVADLELRVGDRQLTLSSAATYELGLRKCNASLVEFNDRIQGCRVSAQCGSAPSGSAEKASAASFSASGTVASSAVSASISSKET